MSSQEFSRHEIRLAVREALHEALSQNEKDRKSPPPGHRSKLMRQLMDAAQNGCKTPVKVDLDTDRKINEFVSDLMICLQDRNLAGLIGAGRLKFESVRPSAKAIHKQNCHPSARQSKTPVAANGRIDSGVVTESKILALSKTHQQIEIGQGVVLTPLAKDRARRLNMQLVRQQQ